MLDLSLDERDIEIWVTECRGLYHHAHATYGIQTILAEALFALRTAVCKPAKLSLLHRTKFRVDHRARHDTSRRKVTIRFMK